MRRIAFAGIAILAIAIVAVVTPGRWNKPDAESVLMGVAHAMANAKSLHLVARGRAPAAEVAAGSPVSLRAEEWLTARAVSSRYLTPEGTLFKADLANADTGEWWYYDGKTRTRYVADLAPVATQAAHVIEKSSQMVRRMFLSDRITDVLGEGMQNARKSVTTETRNGRKVTVVTITHTAGTSQDPVTARSVFEIDARTKRLLAVHQYARRKGSPEELVATVEQIDYDAPFPADPKALGVPEGANAVAATATIEETEYMVLLAMRADGIAVHRMAVPRGKK